MTITKHTPALTICQPYAHLIITGQKRVENRNWFTSHRGPLLIHAGKSRRWLGVVGVNAAGEKIDGNYDIPLQEMAWGAIVGIATLTHCIHIDAVRHFTKLGDDLHWLPNHEHAIGPECWVLENVQRFDQPIPCQGHQQLWYPDAQTLAQIQKAVKP